MTCQFSPFLQQPASHNFYQQQRLKWSFKMLHFAPFEPIANLSTFYRSLHQGHQLQGTEGRPFITGQGMNQIEPLPHEFTLATFAGERSLPREFHVKGSKRCSVPALAYPPCKFCLRTQSNRWQNPWYHQMKWKPPICTLSLLSKIAREVTFSPLDLFFNNNRNLNTCFQHTMKSFPSQRARSPHVPI